VHNPLSPHHPAAVGRSDRLVPEADPSTGMVPPKWRMASTETPASAGEQGRVI